MGVEGGNVYDKGSLDTRSAIRQAPRDLYRFLQINVIGIRMSEHSHSVFQIINKEIKQFALSSKCNED